MSSLSEKRQRTSKTLESLVFFVFLMAESLAAAGPSGTATQVTTPIQGCTSAVYNGTLKSVQWNQVNLCSVDQLNQIKTKLLTELQRLKNELAGSSSSTQIASITAEIVTVNLHITTVVNLINAAPPPPPSPTPPAATTQPPPPPPPTPPTPPSTDSTKNDSFTTPKGAAQK